MKETRISRLPAPAETAAGVPAVDHQPRVGLRAFWHRYRRHRGAVVGLFSTALFLVLSLLAPVVAPHDPRATQAGPVLTGPTRQYWLGTDDLGRDLLSGVLYGTRTSMLVGILAAPASGLIGIVIGSLAGYFGGRVDEVLMRIAELFLIIPKLVLALVIVAIFGASIWNVIFVLGILSWPPIARVVRAEFLVLREMEFTEAARALGMPDLRIIFSEILPNAMPPAIVSTSLQVASAILLEAGLSFLGLGDPHYRSLGLLLNDALPMFRTAWWTAVFPGVTITLLVIGINLIGDGLNDALNPRLRNA